MKICIFLTLLIAASSGRYDGTELLKRSNDRFTANMFNALYLSRPNENVLLSAFSVLPLLGLLSLASVGESQDQLLHILDVPNEAAVKTMFTDYDKNLRAVKGVELKSASAIYIPKTSELDNEFAETAKAVFKSEVKKVDFSKNFETAKEINQWVEKQTNNRIKDLVPPASLSAGTEVLLVNALYFKGIWKYKFDPKLTKQLDFHITKDKKVQVPMMHTESYFRYAHSDLLKAKLLELNFEGDEASFLAILPDEVDGLADLMQSINNVELFNGEIGKMFRTKVEVTIPKFKVELTNDLKNLLQKVGVTDLFTLKGKLAKMVKGQANIFVSDAIQKVFFEVTEEGAEAAAANAISVGFAPGMPPPERFIFRADHPFVYLLKTQEQTLFSGAMWFDDA